ncbi:MAG: TonB-dependent receptor [Pacificimonas sp.]
MKKILLASALIPAFLFPASAQEDTGKAASDTPVIITASRRPVSLNNAGDSITLIDAATIRALDPVQTVDLLRLSPGISISQGGGVGSQTQVRLRGSEANHTLVFVDGIAMNDVGSSNEFRWEFLPAEGLAGIEILRGPASALWGSEALGGVVSINTYGPGDRTDGFASAEYGSFDTVNISAGASSSGDIGGVSLLGTYYDTDGIDAFAGGADEKDGFEIFSITAKGNLNPGQNGQLGLVARFSESDIAFDGNDPVTFQRADTASNSENRQIALRGFADATVLDGWNHHMEATWLQTDNINFDGKTQQNRTDGESLRLLYQTGISFETGAARHSLTGAAEYRAQDYGARDSEFGGFTNQDVGRERKSLVANYRLDAGRFDIGASLRHDDHDQFRDATTYRVAAKIDAVAGVYVRGSIAEGFATPTFTEQFGFFPGSFSGNPDLIPESSLGWDAAIGWASKNSKIEATWFRTDLENEIITVFDAAFNSTAANRSEDSRRQGLELTGETVQGPITLRGSYTYLDAEEDQVAGAAPLREVRRARHAASLTAIADFDQLTLSATANYVGTRRDVDFDSFPALDVKLEDYILASVSARYALTDRIALKASVDNLFDERYQDVFAFETPGISARAGVVLTYGQ